MSLSERGSRHWRPLWVGVASTVLLVGLAQLVGVRGLYLAIGFCVAPVLGLLLSKPPRGLTMHAPSVLRVRVGESLTHVIVFSNNGTRATPPCRVHLRTPGLSDAELWCPQLEPGGRATAEVERTGLERSASAHHSARAEGAGLGGQYHPIYFKLLGRSIVHPRQVAPLPLLPAGTGQDGPLLHRGGQELSGVRQWAPGDSRRGIHWRATARHGSLVVADREQPAAEVYAALIVSGAGLREDDLALIAAGAVAALKSGCAVRVVYAGETGPQWAPVISTTALLDWFSGLELAPSTSGQSALNLPDPAGVAALLGGQGSWLLHAGAPAAWLSAVEARCPLIDAVAAQHAPSVATGEPVHWGTGR